MAPRNMANIDCNRYSLRAWKQQSSFEKIVPENVTTKADFLHLFGLTLCNNIPTSINCQNRTESECKCSDNKIVEIMDSTEKDSATLRPCWVVVPNEQCSSCKRSFKCKSDLNNHVHKRHRNNKVKKRVRMVLRIGQEIVREKYVKKKHLAPSCSIQRLSPDYTDPLVKEGFNCNRISTPIVGDTPTLSPSSLLNSDESVNDDDQLTESLESQNSNDSADHSPCSATPSVGTEMELPVCNVECNCCVKDIISKTQKDTKDIQDQNNNSFCNNNNNDDDLSMLSNNDDKKTNETLEINETIVTEDHDLESEDIECCSRSVSVQTPSCWEYRTLTLLEYSRALEADKRRKEEDERAAASADADAALAARVNDGVDVITIDDDIDNSILERKFNETNDLPLDDDQMKETTEDSEIEEILRITRQQPEKPLLISDAIQALIASERHLGRFEKFKNNDLIGNFEGVDDDKDNDDDFSFCATLHLHSDEKHHHLDDFDTIDMAKFQKTIDDDDVSNRLIDFEERNYTFNIRDDFDYEEFQMYSMKQMAKAKSLREEFDSESRSWKKPNHDRLSITSAPISFFSNHQNPSIIIKEELTIDDYSFSTE